MRFFIYPYQSLKNINARLVANRASVGTSLSFFLLLFGYPAVYRRLLEPPVGAYLEARELACLGMLVNGDRLHPHISCQLLNREDIVFWHKNTTFYT